MPSEDQFYSPDLFAHLASVEGGHWWFRARNRVLLWVLATKVGHFQNLLEVGCGTGFVLKELRRAYPHAELFGADYFNEGLDFARKRVPTALFRQQDITEMTEAEQFDVIGAFDVIEHIEQDEDVLRNLARALQPGGALLLTVPQHRWLWSTVDEQACHVRRYVRKELLDKVRDVGLQVEYVTSFVSILLPAMWANRLRARSEDFDELSEFRLPVWLNSLLEAAMCLELVLLKSGVRFLAGGSLLVLARKPG